MVIVECCAWCGGPHPTVVNCKKASRKPDQFMEDYKRDTVEGLIGEIKRLRAALFEIQCEQLDRATDIGRSAHSLRKMAMATRGRIIEILVQS